METKTKSNPVISFLKRIFERLSNSALFSVLSTNASSTIGDQYLEDSEDFDAYKRQAAEETGLTDSEYKSLEEAFRTAGDNVYALEQETIQVPKHSPKSGLDKVTPEPQAEVVQRTSDGKAKNSRNDNELTL